MGQISERMLDILAEIALRPGMYIGSDSRPEQLRNLTWVLLGAQVALRKVFPEGEDFLSEFARFLRETHGYSVARGPVAAVLDITGGDADRAWALFWDSVEEFRKSLKQA